jgi:hypothetical protein
MNLLNQFLKDFCKPAGITFDGGLTYSLNSPKETVHLGGSWDKIHEALYVLVVITENHLKIEVWHKGSDDEPENQRSLPINTSFKEITETITELLFAASAPYIALDVIAHDQTPAQSGK